MLAGESLSTLGGSNFMLKEGATAKRNAKLHKIAGDLVIVGGGLAGTCCAITAARAGLKVVLIQDRPVLGGNASSEIRLWVLGATSHMGNNNRWAREGGVIDEILVENMYRNPEGNPVIVDTILLEKVANEANIVLLLNTVVYDLEKSDDDTISLVRAFCSQNSIAYEASAPLFVDASGDGVVGFMAGAAFRMGAEARAEFGEKLAPERSTNEMLGHSIYFYSKDTGRPVKFIPPSFASKDISRVARFREFSARDFGCRLWWIEWGGQRDTISESELIKWELWKVVYGVWDHIKNSGQFPEAETLALEWVGSIPGKRESRRFEGDYILRQQDIVEQRQHVDAVSFGGWAIDLHPSEGVFSEKPGCTQWHSKGVYQIPYRCFYSRNITNLFLAGRIMSASHVAFASIRVMATCAHGGQVVAVAAALCKRHQLKPRELLAPPLIQGLQRELQRTGQFIPGVVFSDVNDLAGRASIFASSELRLAELKPSGETLRLSYACAMMLPVSHPGKMSQIELILDVTKSTTLQVELRASSRPGNHTPDIVLNKKEMPLDCGVNQKVTLRFDQSIDQPVYVFVCLMANDAVAVHLSEQRVTGVLFLSQNFNRAVAKSARQEAPAGHGIDGFEFWLPSRRPGGKNFAMRIDPPLEAFSPANLKNGVGRPTNQPNAWVSALEDKNPSVTLKWPEAKTIARIELVFDTDYDHPMESVLMGHSERIMPFCVPNIEVLAETAAASELDGGPLTRATNGIPIFEGVAKPIPVQASPEFSYSRERQLAVAWMPETDEESGAKNNGANDGCSIAKLEGNHESRRVIRLDQPVKTRWIKIRLLPNAGVPAALFSVRCYEENAAAFH